LNITDSFFGPSGKTVIVALEHGTMFGVLPELNDTGKMIEKVLSAGVDGVITSYGIARKYKSLLKDTRLILRMDGGSSELSKSLRFKLLYTVEDALALGASAVICMGFSGGQQQDTLDNVATLAVQCDKVGLPLIAEMLPGGFSNDIPKTPENIKLISRIGAELGAHIVKTAFVGDETQFREIVEGCPSPVVVLGGTQTPNVSKLFSDIESAMKAGAKGAVVGRNIWQHRDAGRFAQVLVDIVHDGKGWEEATAKLAGME
jgi:fructose-bisphosphate aldolase, class I